MNVDGSKFLTVSNSPHMKSGENTRGIMLDVCIAMIPALLWGVYIFGWRALIICLISVGSCLLFEYGFEKITKKTVTVSDFSAVVTGLLLALNLPASVSLWVPVAGAFFAIVVVKMLFGGIGMNIVNPALAARVFIFTSWPSQLTANTRPFDWLSPFKISAGADVVTMATPLSQLKQGALPSASLFDMILGNVGGTIGEISAVMLAVGFIYLLVRKVIRWHIPVAFVGTVALLSLIFPQVQNASLMFMLSEIFSGGLLLGAIFMATDYTTSPVTTSGRLIFGAGCGLITVFIRYFGGFPEGVSFAILIMNLLVWYIDKFTRPVRFGAERKKAKNAK